MTEDEFRAEMLRRGWTEKEVEKSIAVYHELLDSNPELKEENISIDFLLCEPIYDYDSKSSGGRGARS